MDIWSRMKRGLNPISLLWTLKPSFKEGTIQEGKERSQKHGQRKIPENLSVFVLGKPVGGTWIFVGLTLKNPILISLTGKLKDNSIVQVLQEGQILNRVSIPNYLSEFYQGITQEVLSDCLKSVPILLPLVLFVYTITDSYDQMVNIESNL